MLRLLVLALLSCAGLLAAEDQARPEEPAAPPEAAPLPETDPGLHVEARGAQVYRSRDLDALLLVARRQLGRTLREDEERALRRLLARILVEREPLLPLIAQLPAELSPHARDQLLLDLLAYQPEPAPEPPPAAVVDEGPLPPSTEGLAPPSAEPPPEAAPPLAESLIPLPPIRLSRRGRDGGSQQLAIELALQLGPDDQREQILAKLPLLQDAVLTTLHGLDQAALQSPDPTALKQSLGQAVRSAVPGFTGSVLITALDDPALRD